MEALGLYPIHLIQASCPGESTFRGSRPGQFIGYQTTDFHYRWHKARLKRYMIDRMYCRIYTKKEQTHRGIIEAASEFE